MSQSTNVLGTDILFTDDFQVTKGGDYMTVDGIANLRAAVLRRLMTTPGSFRFRPDYGAGLPTYVRKRLTKATKDQLIQTIKRELAKERRITKVLEVTLTQSETQPMLEVTVRIQALNQEIRWAPFVFVQEG